MLISVWFGKSLQVGRGLFFFCFFFVGKHRWFNANAARHRKGVQGKQQRGQFCVFQKDSKIAAMY